MVSQMSLDVSVKLDDVTLLCPTVPRFIIDIEETNPHVDITQLPILTSTPNTQNRNKSKMRRERIRDRKTPQVPDNQQTLMPGNGQGMLFLKNSSNGQGFRVPVNDQGCHAGGTRGGATDTQPRSVNPIYSHVSSQAGGFIRESQLPPSTLEVQDESVFQQSSFDGRVDKNVVDLTMDDTSENKVLRRSKFFPTWTSTQYPLLPGNSNINVAPNGTELVSSHVKASDLMETSMIAQSCLDIDTQFRRFDAVDGSDRNRSSPDLFFNSATTDQVDSEAFRAVLKKLNADALLIEPVVKIEKSDPIKMDSISQPPLFVDDNKKCCDLLLKQAKIDVKFKMEFDEGVINEPSAFITSSPDGVEANLRTDTVSDRVSRVKEEPLNIVFGSKRKKLSETNGGDLHELNSADEEEEKRRKADVSGVDESEKCGVRGKQRNSVRNPAYFSPRSSRRKVSKGVDFVDELDAVCTA